MKIEKKIACIGFLFLLMGHPLYGRFLLQENNVCFERQKDSIQLMKDSADYYLRVGDSRRALSFVQKSHDLVLTVYDPNSPEMARSLLNIGTFSSYNWEYDSALIFLNKAEKIYLESEVTNKNFLGILYSNMGRIHKILGNYHKAQEYYSYANRFLNNETLDPFVYWEANLYIRQAILESALNNFQMSLNYFKKSFKLIQRLPDNSAMLISYYINTANTYAKINDYNKSIDLQLNAIDICKKDLNSFNGQLIILYNNIGLDYLELGNFNKSEDYFNLAIEMQKKISQKSEQYSELFESIGNLFERKSNYSKALENYQKAMQIITNEFTPIDFFSNPEIEQISNKLLALKILKSKSRCLSALYNEEKDFKYLEIALNSSLLQIELVEEMRNSYQSFEAKLQMAELENYTYKAALELANHAFEISNDVKYSLLAFEISEKSRSAVLLSSLREIDAREFGELPENLLLQEKKLLKEIAFFKENIYEENQTEKPNQKKLQDWGEYLLEAENQYEQLIKQYEKDYPNYYQLKYNNTVITPRKIQNQLSQNASILEYCVLDDMLHTFVVTEKDFYFTSTPIDSSFFQLVNDYLNEYQNFDYSKQSYSNYTQFCWNSNSLYKILIEPVEELIKGDHLIIVPEGILSFLPFETLIKETPDSLSSEYFKDLKYLLYDYNISYSYSSTLYTELGKKSSHKRVKKLLAFAPEYNANSISLANKKELITRQKKYRRDLYPIPGVIDEVNAIKNLIPSEVFIGKDATETNFRNIAESYDILHLAMHTVIDNDNPMFSKLIFTLGQDTLNDGLLNTFEIFSLKLNARLVVLSACSTGDGNYNQGEGVMSLARSFAYAGSPSILMTLWEVEDKSGVKLMKEFYTSLIKGMTKSEALRNAKIKFIKEAKPENSHPFFWSAYITMGNTDPLYGNKYPKVCILVVSVIIILLFLVLIYRKRNKASKTY